MLGPAFVREVRAPHAHLPDGFVLGLTQFKIHAASPAEIEMPARVLRAMVLRIFSAANYYPDMNLETKQAAPGTRMDSSLRLAV